MSTYNGLYMLLWFFFWRGVQTHTLRPNVQLRWSRQFLHLTWEKRSSKHQVMYTDESFALFHTRKQIYESSFWITNIQTNGDKAEWRIRCLLPKSWHHMDPRSHLPHQNWAGLWKKSQSETWHQIPFLGILLQRNGKLLCIFKNFWIIFCL